MTIEEFKSILNDDSMQQKQTNIKIVENKTNGGRLTLAKFYKEFSQYVAEQRKFNNQQEKNWKEQRKFNQSVLKKFDQYDRLFKKHGWVK